MLKQMRRRALRGLLDKLLDQHAERRPLEAQPKPSRGAQAHTAH